MSLRLRVFSSVSAAAMTAALLASSQALPVQASTLAFGQKLLASDGVADDWFGYSVAIDSGIALVGAHQDNDNGYYSGSAYLFDAATGDFLFKLTTPDGKATEFGTSVAINNGVALIGSPGDDNENGKGSAYLFDAATGDFLAKLTAPDSIESFLFGYSVAADNGIALVGAFGDAGTSGSAYLFDIATGNFLSQLTAPDGAGGDAFGYSVAIDNGLALVGAFWDDDDGSRSGSAYLFDVATGNFLAKLTAPDGATWDHFGSSVAIDNGIALIGSPFDSDSGSHSGSAYLFDAATGNFLTKLTAPDGAATDFFGTSVDIDNGTALVGAYWDDDQAFDSGSAYLFDVATGDFLTKLTAPDGAKIDEFGWSVGIENNVAIVGAYRDDDNGSRSGSAYLFAPQPTASTPEPVSLLAMLATVGSFAIVRRRSR